ncbi:MAG: glycogen-binding domain-containing protein [Thermodesulfovibrionales bacterium]
MEEQSSSVPIRSGRLIASLLLVLLSGCSTFHAGPRVVEQGVVFSLSAPSARKVTVAGSFNQWDPERNPLSGPDSSGAWSILLPLEDGRHEYLFFVDGKQWVQDPHAPSADDGLGGKNSVVIIKR